MEARIWESFFQPFFLAPFLCLHLGSHHGNVVQLQLSCTYLLWSSPLVNCWWLDLWGVYGSFLARCGSVPLVKHIIFTYSLDSHPSEVVWRWFEFGFFPCFVSALLGYHESDFGSCLDILVLLNLCRKQRFHFWI
jgi:hypothetical protein